MPTTRAVSTSSRFCRPAISVVIPVRNAGRHLDRVLDAIAAQSYSGRIEIIVVDDGSKDGSRERLQAHASAGRLRLLAGRGAGAAAALNRGIGAATHEFIAQIDQDVIIGVDWLERLIQPFADETVAAVQARYVADRRAGWWSRVMALDLSQRYARLGRFTDHVCTGNVIYRRRALTAIGGFDESLGYGYDNDLSYRLMDAGYELVFCREAISTHAWREGMRGYVRQQYGFGYGRLDLIGKHRHRFTGDDVSPSSMMLHAPAMLWALLALTAAGVLRLATAKPASIAIAAALQTSAACVVAVLAVDRLIAGLRAMRTFDDKSGLLFAPVHLVRDLSWAAAIVVWTVRRAAGRPRRAADSMAAAARAGDGPVFHSSGSGGDRASENRPVPLVLIPAYNEADCLPAVVAELRACAAGLDILVVDDGSTDRTGQVIRRLGVPSLRLARRVGTGGAVRAGLRHARAHAYEFVIRLDGDGQHPAAMIDLVLEPLRRGDADVVIGSRYLTDDAAGAPSPTVPPSSSTARRAIHRALAALLSAVAHRPITDATSGLWAFGPRAIDVLADHHPSGYPEPELRLLLSRTGLRVMERPVVMRARFAGRTSLTTRRTGAAFVRLLFSMAAVPFRAAVRARR